MDIAIWYWDIFLVVGVAQVVEHRVVAPVVEGSNPFTHPIYFSYLFKPLENVQFCSIARNPKILTADIQISISRIKIWVWHRNWTKGGVFQRFKFAPVAQLDRAPDFESVGRRFESCRAYQEREESGIWGIIIISFFILPAKFGPSRQVERQRNPAAVWTGFESCPRKAGFHIWF